MGDNEDPSHENMEEMDFSFDDFEVGQVEGEDMDEDDCPLIRATKEEVQEWFKPWDGALVTKLIRKNLGPRIIEEQIMY